MKRFLGCVSLSAAVCAAPFSAAADPAAAVKRVDPAPVRVVAPADEYFGKMKMSILGIRNEIRDTTLRIGFEPAKAESYLSVANLTEDAMSDWERKYPTDPWIPKTLFSLERMYETAPWSYEFNARAKRVMAFIRAHFAATWYGKEARRELAAGTVGKHLATPAPVVDATPAPAPPAAAGDAQAK